MSAFITTQILHSMKIWQKPDIADLTVNLQKVIHT